MDEKITPDPVAQSLTASQNLAIQLAYREQQRLMGQSDAIAAEAQRVMALATQAVKKDLGLAPETALSFRDEPGGGLAAVWTPPKTTLELVEP